MSARRARLALIGAVCVAASACYGYVPLGDLPPKPGAEVRADLSQPVEFTMHQVTYRGILVAQGRLLYMDADSVVLATSRVWSSSGESYLGEGVGIVLPRGGIRQLNVKRLSAGKTVLALGAGGAAIGAVIVGVGPLIGSGGGTKPKPPP